MAAQTNRHPQKLLLNIYISIMGLVCVVPLIYYLDTQTYRYIVREDHWVEYLTALFLLWCAASIFRSLCRKWSHISKRQKFGLMLMGMAMFVGFGEEISWGQRIFDILSPDFFSKYNLQGETNIHNLKVFDIKLNQWLFTYGVIFVFAFYFYLPFGIQKFKALQKFVHKFGILIPNKSQSLIFLGVSAILHIYDIPKISELWEFAFACTLTIICHTQANQDDLSEKVLIKKPPSQE